MGEVGGAVGFGAGDQPGDLPQIVRVDLEVLLAGDGEDGDVVVPEGARVGVDIDRDRELYTVSDNGIVVIGKGQQVVP